MLLVVAGGESPERRLFGTILKQDRNAALASGIGGPHSAAEVADEMEGTGQGA